MREISTAAVYRVRDITATLFLECKSSSSLLRRSRSVDLTEDNLAPLRRISCPCSKEGDVSRATDLLWSLLLATDGALWRRLLLFGRYKYWKVCCDQGIMKVSIYSLLFHKCCDYFGYLDKLVTDLALNSRYMFEDRLLHGLALLAFFHRDVIHSVSQRTELIPDCSDILGVFFYFGHHLLLLALDHSLNLP